MPEPPLRSYPLERPHIPFRTREPRYDFDPREFGILTTAGVLATLLVLPYALTLQAPLLRKVTLPLPLGMLLVVQMVQNAFFIAVAVGLGLIFAWRCALGAPLLEEWLASKPLTGDLKKLFGTAALAGIASSLVIIALDAWLFVPQLPKIADAGAAAPPVWQGFLASFYGGITEELLLRLGVMSFLAWLVGKASHDAQGIPTAGAFWLANLLAAVLFGLGHLPATAAIMPLTRLVVTRAVVLNGIPGLAFGWLYWKRGLEPAMAAHFSADLVLHVLLPAAPQWFHS